MNEGTAKRTVSAVELGIAADGSTAVTSLINGAIAALAASGGGELYFPAGIYLTGTIVLKSNVVLNLGAGAKIRSTGKLEDYLSAEETELSIFENEENMSGALIWGKNLKNIGIVGRGEIDGNGIFITAGEESGDYPEGVNHYGEDNYKFYNTRRPITLKLYDCENVTLEGIRFVNPASWNVGMNRCRNVFCRGLEIRSRNFYNGDGLDFNSCDRVFVSDCSFDCTDDCIALQSAFSDFPCKNIFISNCYFTTLFAGIRIGMSCLGGFENVVVEHCVFENCLCSGLKVQQCEGGGMQNMIFKGLVMKNVARPFFFTHNYYECTAKRLQKAERKEAAGVFGHIVISDCVIDNDRAFSNGGIIFDAAEEFEIGDVTLQNITYRYFAEDCGDDLCRAELRGKRPEADVYGGAVWGGLFLRRCENFNIERIGIENRCAHAGRAALVQNCKNITIEKPVGNALACRITVSECENVKLERGSLSGGIRLDER